MKKSANKRIPQHKLKPVNGASVSGDLAARSERSRAHAKSKKPAKAALHTNHVISQTGILDDRAEMERQESEERWRLALEGAGLGVWDWNLQTGAVFFSTGWKQIIGYLADEIGTSMDEFTSRVHPDDVSSYRAAAQAHFDGQTDSFSSEFRMRCKDGTWKWILSRGRLVLRDSEGNPARMLGTHQDITQGKYTEMRELHNLQLIAEGTPCPAVLNALARSVEARHPRFRCCMMLASPQASQLIVEAQLNLPDVFAAAIAGKAGNKAQECCRSAMQTGTRLIVENLFKDNSWKQLVAASRQGGISSAWFEPILGNKAEALGAVACFSAETRRPSAAEIETVAVAARLAAVAIERSRIQASDDVRTAQLTAIYEHAPTILFYLSVEGASQFRFLSVNRAFLDVTGYTEEQVIGKLAPEIIPPGSHELVFDCYETAVRTKTTVQWTEESDFPTGVKYGRASVTPVIDDKGIVRALVGIVHDLTSSRKMETALKTSKDRLTLALRHTPVILSTQNLNLVYTWLHSSRPDFPAGNAIGKTDEQLLPKSSSVPLTELKNKVLETGRPLRREIQIVMPSGEVGHFDISLTPLRDHKRRISGIIGSALDITERVRTGAALRFIEEQYRKLEQEHEEKVSHYEELIVVTRAIQRERLRLASDLHDGLLQFLVAADYRMQAAEGAPDCTPSVTLQIESARQLLKRMKGELRNSITGLQLLAEGEGSFMDLLRQSVSSMSHWPEGAIVFTTAGEPREVSQSLAGNLLLLFQEAVGNAFKHGDARHVSVHVSFTKQNLAMKIRDDGRGFVPGEAPSTVAGHFGIAGMKRRMQWLGGSLQVRSKPGEGAEITITLPWKT